MLSKNSRRRLRRAQEVYATTFQKTHGSMRSISETQHRILKGTLSPTEEVSYYANLRNTLYRRLAAYYIMPDVFYHLRIPKKKLGKSKEIIRSLMNSFADGLEDFEEETKNLTIDNKIKAWKQLKSDFKSYVEEAESDLKKISVKRKLDFVIDLFLRKMKEAKSEQNNDLE